jgi:hypothetical protein
MSNTTSREVLETISVFPSASLHALLEALRQTSNLQSNRVYHSASKANSVNKSLCRTHTKSRELCHAECMRLWTYFLDQVIVQAYLAYHASNPQNAQFPKPRFLPVSGRGVVSGSGCKDKSIIDCCDSNDRCCNQWQLPAREGNGSRRCAR